MRKIKNDSGFSLLEIIISIAALSFTSIFILQMFMASSNVNRRARDADVATAEAISAIENFKKQPGLDNYLMSEGFSDISEHDSMMTVCFFYDQDWNRLEAGAEGFPGMPPDTRYYLQLDITSDDGFYADRKEGVTYGGLYSVEANVVEMSSLENRRTLVSLQSKKYFPKFA